jgi:hypothetical protein|tara:strand:- start:847 stop:1467 length:621 start_codon:yes stop_codon:yes gene_type:complete
MDAFNLLEWRDIMEVDVAVKYEIKLGKGFELEEFARDHEDGMAAISSGELLENYVTVDAYIDAAGVVVAIKATLPDGDILEYLGTDSKTKFEEEFAKLGLTEPEFTALISLAFSIGVPARGDFAGQFACVTNTEEEYGTIPLGNNKWIMEQKSNVLFVFREVLVYPKPLTGDVSSVADEDGLEDIVIGEMADWDDIRNLAAFWLPS